MSEPTCERCGGKASDWPGPPAVHDKCGTQVHPGVRYPPRNGREFEWDLANPLGEPAVPWPLAPTVAQKLEALAANWGKEAKLGAGCCHLICAVELLEILRGEK